MYSHVLYGKYITCNIYLTKLESKPSSKVTFLEKNSYTPFEFLEFAVGLPSITAQPALHFPEPPISRMKCKPTYQVKTYKRGHQSSSEVQKYDGKGGGDTEIQDHKKEQIGNIGHGREH